MGGAERRSFVMAHKAAIGSVLIWTLPDIGPSFPTDGVWNTIRP